MGLRADNYAVAAGVKIHGGRFSAVAATALTVNEVSIDSKIFQRSPNSTSKIITVSGESNGSIVQARVVDAISGSVVQDWMTIVTNHAGGAYNAPLVVNMGYMSKLQVRDGVDTTKTAACVRKFAVGVVIATAGQSNMYLLYTESSLYPLATQQARNFYATSGVWEYVANHDDTNTYPPNTPFSTYGATKTNGRLQGDGIAYFVNYLSASLGCAVGTLNYAVSGSRISQWQPSGGSIWATFSAALTASGNDCEMALWYQGEEDASINTAPSSWQASLLNIMNGLKTQTGRDDTNFHFGVVTLGSTTTYGAEGTFGGLRGAQLAFVDAHAAAFLAGVAMDQQATGGSVHLTAAGYSRMGKRYAKSAYARLLGADKPGPRIASATRSSAVVTVNIAGGTGVLKDGAGGAGASLLGFRVYDAGVLVTINSIGISGSTVVITLSAVPSGSVTMDYGMANSPFGSLTPTAAAVLYDSDTVPGDTLGLPLQPRALFTVA